jgi:hypothetical protein
MKNYTSLSQLLEEVKADGFEPFYLSDQPYGVRIYIKRDVEHAGHKGVLTVVHHNYGPDTVAWRKFFHFEHPESDFTCPYLGKGKKCETFQLDNGFVEKDL